jgi:hypothetical protein
MWEVLTGDEPYQSMTPLEVGQFVANGKQLPPLATNEHWMLTLVKLMQRFIYTLPFSKYILIFIFNLRCGDSDNNKRPTFAQLQEEISAITKKVMGKVKYVV